MSKFIWIWFDNCHLTVEFFYLIEGLHKSIINSLNIFRWKSNFINVLVLKFCFISSLDFLLAVQCSWVHLSAFLSSFLHTDKTEIFVNFLEFYDKNALIFVHFKSSFYGCQPWRELEFSYIAKIQIFRNCWRKFVFCHLYLWHSSHSGGLLSLLGTYTGHRKYPIGVISSDVLYTYGFV